MSQNLHLLRPDLTSALTSPEEAVSWLEILAMKPAVHIRTVWDKRSPRPETFTSSNKIDNMSCSCRQTPCIDYHVKQHSWGADLKTSQEKNADMRSVQEGVWFRTKARGNCECSAFRNEYSEARMNKDTQQEIGLLLRGSPGVRRTEEETLTTVWSMWGHKNETRLSQSFLQTHNSTWQAMTVWQWFRPPSLPLNQAFIISS